MAIILKREEQRASASAVHQVKSFFSRKSVLVGLILLAGSTAIGVGQLMEQGTWSFASTALSARDLTSLPAVRLFEEKRDLQAEAAKIWAALQAQAQEGVPEGDLTQLSPAYLPSNQGEPPAYLTQWRRVEGLLLHAVSKPLCASIAGSTPTAILYGKSGLNCIEINGEYVASYHYTQSPLMQEVDVPVTLSGRWESGLTRWRVATEALEAGAACSATVETGRNLTISQVVTLSEENTQYEATLCLPSRIAEQLAVSEGLSLFQGVDAVALSGFAVERPWTLELVAQTCNSGRSSMAHWRFAYGTLPALRWSGCDLTSKLIHSPTPRLIAPDLSPFQPKSVRRPFKL